jgi:hypothetical protein
MLRYLSRLPPPYPTSLRSIVISPTYKFVCHVAFGCEFSPPNIKYAFLFFLVRATSANLMILEVIALIVLDKLQITELLIM